MASRKLGNRVKLPFKQSRNNTGVSVAESRRQERSESMFPIVGIGASAGGLEALERFLGHVPDDSGICFVIVQHLDPTHKGIMPELLQRCTHLKVVQVKDRTRVQPDSVYVIPPNKDMSILHGILHLLDPVAPRGLRLPIDFFFRSLAADQKALSIGVILSGMGSDGSQGLKAIKEEGGFVFVQEPASAKFDGMPRSAIDAGLGEVIASAEDLPAKIIEVIKNAPKLHNRDVTHESKTINALDKIFILLRAHTGHDFSMYKKSTMYRRIERRMNIHQLGKIANYIRLLQENPQEIDLLFKELLIGVTGFFRDSAAWEQLKSDVLPSLLANRSSPCTLRAWSTGCSTGEEAYSLAIIFKEAVEKLNKPSQRFTLQIFATDLDREAIDRARQGLYQANITSVVSQARLSRFFVKEERGYRISKEIREMVIFAPQNLIMDPPFTKLDILVCRNLLIYLLPELQKKILPLFHYSLKPGGILFLGSSESIGTFSDMFVSLNGSSRLYRRHDGIQLPGSVDFPSSFAPARPSMSDRPKKMKPIQNLQALAEQMLLRWHSPSAVLVNDKGDILWVNGRTGKYLEPAAGKANLNLLAMARDGLRNELNDVFRNVLGLTQPLKLGNLRVRTDGGVQHADVTLQRIDEPESMRGMIMVVFTDIAAPPAMSKRDTKQFAGQKPASGQTGKELQQVKEQLQTLREAMQSSQEELKSANEELQSTNEELQSTNEELTTSKEEMQSMNEELQTVNQEQQAKMDELARTNNDMKNLLNSTDIATVFLDNELRLRRFTTQATKIIHLIPGDAGRPITDIVSDVKYHQLADDAREVLRTLITIEKQVTTDDGRWFAVRIMPYRTLNNVIDGVAITFAEVTVAKKLEASLRAASELFQTILHGISDAFVSMNRNMTVNCFNAAAEQVFKRKGTEVIGKCFFDVFPETKETIFYEKVHQAITAKTSLSFESYFGAEPYRGWYDTSVYTNAEGVSVIFRLKSERSAASEKQQESVP